ncbi:hypothetical protein AJ80_00369 [Polytolypa hystricis UAMH7299]|uniref:Uncharacterized protein n=1 Tax=Polytolypa hystricis (strain UAMH7299) TaxID=1447883 RepID=A0A2B7Z3J3_POLH7|nr:hypothetical protein AJ80_00369 [Polytolypa hystricis UAMH7299]
MASLDQLPAELLREISKLVASNPTYRNEDKFSLMLVCRALRPFAELMVCYEHIEIASCDFLRMHCLLRTLVERPDLAQRVNYIYVRRSVEGHDKQLTTEYKQLEVNLICALYEDVDQTGVGNEETESDDGSTERVDLERDNYSNGEYRMWDSNGRARQEWLDGLNRNAPGVFLALIISQTLNLEVALLCPMEGIEFMAMIFEKKVALYLSDAANSPVKPLQSVGFENRSDWKRTVRPGVVEIPDQTINPKSFQEALSLLYIPTLKSLSLCGIDQKASLLWSYEHPPAALQLYYLHLGSFSPRIKDIGPLFSACPNLSVFLYDAWDDEVEQKTLDYSEVKFVNTYPRLQKFELELIPSTRTINGNHGTMSRTVVPFTSLTMFPRLRALAIPILSLLGSSPRAGSSQVKDLLPSSLVDLTISDDTYMVEPLIDYLSMLFSQLQELVEEKKTHVPLLNKLRIRLITDMYPTEEQAMGLREACYAANVKFVWYYG